MAKKGKGGGGGGKNTARNFMAPFMVLAFGSIALFIALVMFVMALAQLDTAITTVSAYAEQVSLPQIMGVWGIIFFLALIGVGIGLVLGGGIIQARRAAGGDWMQIIMGFILAAVGAVFAIIMFTITSGELHTAYLAANASVNKTAFAGLLSIMGIFGTIIWLAFAGAATSGIVGAGVGSYKNIKGMW